MARSRREKSLYLLVLQWVRQRAVFLQVVGQTHRHYQVIGSFFPQVNVQAPQST
jgi:hypothetical protein